MNYRKWKSYDAMLHFQVEQRCYALSHSMSMHMPSWLIITESVQLHSSCLLS